MKETDLQKQLADACNEAGGFGYKTANRFLVGIADLYLALEPYPPLWLEVKFERSVPRSGIIPINTTTHQQRFIRSVNKHSMGRASAVVLCTMKRDYGIWVIPRSVAGSADKTMDPMSCIKKYGQPWPIAEIIRRATC